MTALVLAAILTGGILTVPMLENYAFTGIMLTAAVLYGVFLLAVRGNGAITTILALAFALMRVAGVAEQALVGTLAVTLPSAFCSAYSLAGYRMHFSPMRPRSS